MSNKADLARKCFAVAASTSIEGEREAAINRGMSLLEKGGLDPDDFDIPGRERQAKDRGFYDGPGMSSYSEDIRDLIREAWAESRKQASWKQQADKTRAFFDRDGQPHTTQEAADLASDSSRRREKNGGWPTDADEEVARRAKAWSNSQAEGLFGCDFDDWDCDDD